MIVKRIRADLRDPAWIDTRRACDALQRSPKTLRFWEKSETYIAWANITLPKLETKMFKGKKYYLASQVELYRRHINSLQGN